MFLTYFLITCSALMFIWTACTVFWRYKYNSRFRLKKNFIAVVLLFSAVFFLVCSGVCLLNSSPDKLDGPNSFVKVLSYTFQLFTLDETFEQAMEWMALMPSGFFRGLYLGLSVLYSVLVPLAGGFIIFNLLSSIAPKFRLAMGSLRRTKYVFSELNERSVTLAEDIAEQSWKARRIGLGVSGEDAKWLKSSLIIFTNVKRDDADTELLERADRIGAICLSADILERSFYFFTPQSKKIVYFMMDTNPWSNLDSAITLLSEKRELWKRTITERVHGEASSDDETHGTAKRRRIVRLRKTDNMNMYVFTENPEASTLLEEAFGYNCEMRDFVYHDDKKDKWMSSVAIAGCDSNITVFVVNEYKNLVYQLLRENGGEALLEPLKAGASAYAKNDGENSDSNVEADGGKRLKIAVFGSGKIAKEFFKTAVWCAQILDPDVKDPINDGREYKTVTVDLHMISENAKDFEQSLKFSSPGLFGDDGKCAYLHSATFENAGFGTEKFRELFETHGLDKANFFLIALGDDDMNMQVASWTRTRLLRGHVGGDVEIYFAIENDALCKTLKRRSERAAHETVRLHPFGSLTERFSFDNIVRPDIERIARDIDSIHDGRRAMRTYISNYNFESSIASALHSPYRMYGVEGMDLTAENTVNRLYWLEHLRWCAYTASIGLTLPSARSFLSNKDGKGKVSTKNTSEGWHSCLVKSDTTYIAPTDLLLDILNAFDIEVPKGGDIKEDLAVALKQLNKIVMPDDSFCEGDEALDKYLERWYKERILDVKGDKLHETTIDQLDLLDLFISIHNMYPVDLKSYDVSIAKKTFASIRQQTISDELRKARPDTDVIRREIKAISGAQNNGGIGGAASGDDMQSVRTSYIASVGDCDLILLRGGYLSSLRMKGGSDISLGDAEVKDIELSARVKKHVIPIDENTLLVRLPFKKPVCIGYRAVQGGKDKYVYLYQEARHCYVFEQKCDDGGKASAFDNLTYVYIGEASRAFNKENSYNLTVGKRYEKREKREEVAKKLQAQNRE